MKFAPQFDQVTLRAIELRVLDGVTRRPKREIRGAAVLAGALAAGLLLTASQKETARVAPVAATSTGELLLESATANEPPALHAPLRGAFSGDATLRFSDRSTVHLSDAHLDVTGNSATEVRAYLGHGRAEFDITPNGPRVWTLATPHAEVTVLGTQFAITVGDGRTRVDVSRGHVRVSSPHWSTGPVELGPRQSVVAETAARLASSSSSAPGARAGMGSLVRHQDAAPHNKAAIPGDATEGRQIQGSARELLEAADRARAAHKPAEAREHLRALIDRYPDDPRAALGAYTLGNLERDEGRSLDGARAYERALELGLPTSLRRDALENTATLYRANGRDDDANRVAQRFGTVSPSRPTP